MKRALHIAHIRENVYNFKKLNVNIFLIGLGKAGRVFLNK
jgi:hypothetical protein